MPYICTEGRIMVSNVCYQLHVIPILPIMSHDPHISVTTALHEERMIHTSLTIISISFILYLEFSVIFYSYSLVLQFIGTPFTCKLKTLNQLFLMTDSISIISFIEFRSFLNLCVWSSN